MLIRAALGFLLVAAPLEAARRTWRSSGHRGSGRERLGVAMVVLAATALRLPGITDSLDHLEAVYLFEATKAAGPISVVTSPLSAEQMHQPYGPLLLWGWSAVSRNEWWLRLPSLLFAAATLPLVWALTRESGIGARRAMGACVVAAASPVAGWYARDATPYALLGLWAAAAFALARRLLGRKAPDPPARDNGGGRVRAAPGNAEWAVVGVLLSLAFYTHNHGLWVAVTVMSWLAVAGGRRGRRGGAVAFAAFLLFSAPGLFRLQSALRISVGSLETDRLAVPFSHAMGEAVPEALRVLLGGEWPLTLVPILLVAAGVARLCRSREPLGALVLLGVLLAVVAESHIQWQITRSKGIAYVDARHYLYLTPLLASAAAAATRGLGASVAATAFALWITIPLVWTVRKPDARDAVRYVLDHAESGDAVAFLPAPWYWPIVENYLLPPRQDLHRPWQSPSWWSVTEGLPAERLGKDTLYGFPADPQRIWLSARSQRIWNYWVIHIRDHRFGLPSAPSSAQRSYICWRESEEALIDTRRFGKWVTVDRYDAGKLRVLPPPPRRDDTIETKDSRGAWSDLCR